MEFLTANNLLFV